MRAASVASRVEGEAASVASGAEGVAVSVVRDAIEGVTAPVLLATELVRYGPGNIQFRDINTFRKQLDYLDQQFSDHCVSDKTWYYGGRVVGDTACVVAGVGMTVVGISTIIGGITVTAGGVLATATGVGAVIGVPTIAVSGVAVAEGALVTAGGIGITYASVRNFFDDVPKFMQEISKGGGKIDIPQKAYDVANKIKSNKGAPPSGYKGGRVYNNIPLEGAQKLPDGIGYKEYDINPYIKGQNRGPERIVIGDDGSVWYTNDHYNTFTRIE